MNRTEQESVLTLCLLAAFADGAQSDVERAELKRIAESWPEGEIQPVALYHRVLLGQAKIETAAAALTSAPLRQLAYEMAVCVCEADEALSESEKNFLTQLRRELRLDTAATTTIETQAEQLTTGPLTAPPIMASAATVPVSSRASHADLDPMILNYAMLNGALELLPDTLATMAIIPLQMKMVYRIGKAHGYELDRGHIKDLLATAGVGLTSQVVEGYARKLLGGLLGKVGGGMGRSLGRQVAGSAMSFATTWALGKMAVQYYAGGRKLSAIEMRQLFGSLTSQAHSLHGQHLPAIRDKAGSLQLTQLLPLIRGQQ
jgi:uncharacterized protein (DUF697 family)/tellurite resistance protein